MKGRPMGRHVFGDKGKAAAAKTSEVDVAPIVESQKEEKGFKKYSVLKPVMVPAGTVDGKGGTFSGIIAVGDKVVLDSEGYLAKKWLGNGCIK